MPAAKEKTQRFLVALSVLLTAGVNLASCVQHQSRDSLSMPMPQSAEVIYQSQHCNVEEPQALWINSQIQLQSLFAELRKNIISKQAAQPPVIDFSQYAGLLVAMGRKNTGGYGLELIDNKAGVSDDVLQLAVQWREPAPGMIVTQALTSPCLLLKVPLGEYHHVEIKDQSGVIRLRTML